MITYSYQFDFPINATDICIAIETNSSFRLANIGNDSPTEVHGYLQGGGQSWEVVQYEDADLPGLNSDVPIVVSKLAESDFNTIMDNLNQANQSDSTEKYAAQIEAQKQADKAVLDQKKSDLLGKLKISEDDFKVLQQTISG